MGNNIHVMGEVIPDSQSFASQFELLKIVAELNHEMIFDYEVDKGVARLSEVQNGRFVVVREERDCSAEIWKQYHEEIVEEDIPALAKCFEALRQKPMQKVIEFRFSLYQDEKKWYRFFLVSESSLENNHVDHIAGRLVCVDQEKKASELNRQKAELDALTGVYNHKTFEQLAGAKLIKHKSELIFIMLDIDDFKIINDTQGHHVGDMVISQTGEVFQRMVKGRGIAGRLGGDEFAAIVWSFHNDNEIKEYMQEFREQLKTIIFDLEYSASIGVSIRHGRNMEFKDMYYEADQGAYHAKKNGKNQVVFFDDIGKLNEDAVLEISQDITFEDSELKELENSDEIILVIDEESYRILYVNRKFEEYYRIGFTDLVSSMKLMDILNMKEEELIILRKPENYFAIHADADSTPFYQKLGNNCTSICFSRKINWMGGEAIYLSIIPHDQPMALLGLLNRRSKINNILLKTIEIIGSSKDEERGHAVLKLLVDFFDADCLAVMIPRIADDTEMVIESHQEHASTIAKLFKAAVARGDGAIFEHLFLDEGLDYVSDIKVYKDAYPVVYEALIALRAWAAVTCRLVYQGERCGKLVLLNPRKHLEQRTMLKSITDLIAAEVLRTLKERRSEYEMAHDELTGLLKRDNIMGIQELWDIDKKEDIGIIYCDIVNLRNVNSTYGYAKGNEYIRAAADILKDLYNGYYVFRFEQDCLVAICIGVDQNMFETMVQTTKENFEELPFGVAVGYSWGKYKPFGVLIEEAKDVMEADKKLQKSDDELFTKEQMKVKRDMEEEIAHGNFLVYLQPKMNIRENKLCGAEALIRLRNPERGILGPAIFIPILEKLDLIYMIDLYVMEEVFKFQKSRIDRGLKTVPISVNISKRTLLHSELLNRVAEMVEKYNIPSELIEVEITESIGDLDHVFVAKIAKNLHSMGFLLAMDDLGTQYSNLSMLSQFDFEVAKIDRTIVQGIADNSRGFVILKHLTKMIRELGILCMVEGVETEEELEIVRQTDCDIVQGYYYSRPIPFVDFEKQFM